MPSRRFPVICVLAGAAIIAVTGCAGPPTDRQIIEGADVILPAEVSILAERVAPGATLSSLLHAQQVAEDEIGKLVEGAASVFDVRRLRTDRPYRIIRAVTGALRGFEYEIDADRILRLSRASEHEPFVAMIDDIEKRTKPGIVSGAIDRESSSLFEALSRAGERVDLSVALAEILASEVDFNTELQPGDSFRLLVDKQYRPADLVEGRIEEVFSGYGAVQAVTFENAGRTINAVRFTPRDGKPDYFDWNGRSLRRFFLKSPLKFDPVVTSRFSMGRMHPILGEVRAHLGVDYRAPSGAPIVAVADGYVVSAGASGGAGRMVHLRHANGYETEYLHLSTIDVRAGTRVRQGDVIGKVGATGLATGPHLDYRVRQNGSFVNPTTVHQSMPPGDPVAEADMEAFQQARDRAIGALRVRDTSSRQTTDTE
jgi:murein DD-endopeptidase MepM/ murein hydrolase activator NlpD